MISLGFVPEQLNHRCLPFRYLSYRANNFWHKSSSLMHWCFKLLLQDYLERACQQLKCCLELLTEKTAKRKMNSSVHDMSCWLWSLIIIYWNFILPVISPFTLAEMSIWCIQLKLLLSSAQLPPSSHKVLQAIPTSVDSTFHNAAGIYLENKGLKNWPENY